MLMLAYCSAFSRQGGTTSIDTSCFLAWRKKWAAENGQRKPASVGVALETPSGEALATSAAELKRLLPLLPEETPGQVVAQCRLPAQLEADLSGCDVWKAV